MRKSIRSLREVALLRSKFPLREVQWPRSEFLLRKALWPRSEFLLRKAPWPRSKFPLREVIGRAANLSPREENCPAQRFFKKILKNFPLPCPPTWPKTTLYSNPRRQPGCNPYHLMHNQRLDELFFRYCEKNISDAEREELMTMLLSDEHREQINGLIDQFIRRDGTQHTLSDETADDILSSIFTATARNHADDEPDFQEKSHRPMWLFRLAAASLALLLVYGGYRWLNRPQPMRPAVALHSVYGDDAPAGGNKASLTLANGRTYDLSTITEGNLSVQPGTTIDKAKGEVVYETGANDAVAYNVLRTPLGGQYKIVLPDGSRAWLNAGSSLKYPTAFTGTERDVEMTGEVYFEIEPNKSKPFLVRVVDKKAQGKDMEIKVLGTHFNISSYGDEPTMQTTLLEGSVQVEKDHVTKILAPGQQARVATGTAAPDISVKTVDTESVVAWKEGRFEFNGNIREVMRQISRWYDVDVHYEGNVERKSFAGTISRKNNVSEVLKMLEMTGGIQFRIEDRKITVKNAD